MHAFIKSSFWADSHIENMPPEQKLALVWLITNAGRDSCGFTTVTPRRFTFDSGLPIETLNDACAATCGSIIVLPGNIYFVRGFVRHQFCRGDAFSLKNNVLRSVVKQARRLLPVQQEAFFAEYPELAVPQDNATQGDSPHDASHAGKALPQDIEALPHPAEALPSKIEPLWKGNGTGEGKGTGKEEEEGRDIPMPSPPSPDAPGATMVTVVPAADAAFRLDAASIAELYPRRQSVQEAVRHIARHMADGVDPRAIADGTRAIAAVIRQLPSGHLNAYVPSAEKFFANRRWEDDPRTWLRLAPADGHRTSRNGGQPEKLSLGGRRGRTIRV